MRHRQNALHSVITLCLTDQHNWQPHHGSLLFRHLACVIAEDADFRAVIFSWAGWRCLPEFRFAVQAL